MKVLCRALDLTLQNFDIKGTHLSVASGVATGTISNFRNDLCSITTDSLEKLLENLTEEEFQFFLSQAAHARGLEDFTHSPIALDDFVSNLDDEATANILTALANRLRKMRPKRRSARKHSARQ